VKLGNLTIEFHVSVQFVANVAKLPDALR
jgi:hypothetical protein